MLSAFPLYADLPAFDLARARRWYEDKLGLLPIGEIGPGLLYSSGDIPFLLYPTEQAGSGKHTLASWLVGDLPHVVAGLRSKGVVFEDYSMGADGPNTVGGIASGPNGELAAWFKDSEGNVLSINKMPPSLGGSAVDQTAI